MIKKDLQDFNHNIFELLSKNGALITAGNIDSFNTMTIGWGTMGVLWGKNIFTAYVRPSRYTYCFTEENDYFTISFYDDKYKKELQYLGTKSGRNEDKVKSVGFNAFSIEPGAISFKEAKIHLVCKKLYFQDLDSTKLSEPSIKRYYPNPDYHRFYIGEIVSYYVNE